MTRLLVDVKTPKQSARDSRKTVCRADSAGYKSTFVYLLEIARRYAGKGCRSLCPAICPLLAAL